MNNMTPSSIEDINEDIKGVYGDIPTICNNINTLISVLNEIPNSDVAFAVRDLVNSAIGVITTTHVDRVWHVPNKLNEFFME